ncbi:MAG TPA: hypothetical protein VG204_09470 [Terriglobia bacterium]|nr:hypothetical protein [Terriglobia bacterium]
MRGWYYFWVANFALAGSAFLGIALVVMVGGIGDLRHMFRSLQDAHNRKPADDIRR